jgi:triacylglycerol lipase
MRGLRVMDVPRPLNVLLVPGFFGFGRLGDIDYFAGVRPLLEAALLERGFQARVTEVVTPPTASIRRRAAHVLEALVAVAKSAGDIHVIGHSTGGLDARLAIAETASLPTEARLDDYARLRSVVSISCPHYGTNVATYFTRPVGRALFRIVARYLAFMLERGKLPLAIGLRLGYFALRLSDPKRRRRSTFDQLYERLLNDLTDERRTEVVQFLRQIAAEQALLFQITPAGCDLLNACTLDPPLAYGSVISCAVPPRFGVLLRFAFNLYAQLMYPLYWLLFRLSREKDDALRQQLSAPQLEALDAGLGRPAAARDSDGVVPVLSQVWGRVLHVARGDHLDVVGQYGARGSETAGEGEDNSWGGDWIPSASGFDSAAFAALWGDVAAFIASASNAAASTLRKAQRSAAPETDERSGAKRSD